MAFNTLLILISFEKRVFSEILHQNFKGALYDRHSSQKVEIRHFISTQQAGIR